MASRPNPGAERFAARLSHELSLKGWGNRTLAKALAKDPKGHRQIENARTQIRQYLRGKVNPSPSTRREIATALGLEPTALDEEEDVFPQALLARIAELPRPELTAFDLQDNVDERDILRYRRSALHSLRHAAFIEKELTCRAS